MPEKKTNGDQSNVNSHKESAVSLNDIDNAYRHMDNIKSEILTVLNQYISFNNVQMAKCAETVEFVSKNFKTIETAVTEGLKNLNEDMNRLEVQVKTQMMTVLNFPGTIQ
jgi:hypothetical protein